ncbi:MAG TPA: M23 family metallopeptidase [Luteimonas sp.]|nr:M23 family metallopeptidase [Luteimonas sp.]
MKGLLLFVAGLLVGANLVYFLMRDRAPAAVPAATAPAATTPASTTTPAPERPPAVDSTVPTAEDARRATASKPPRRAVDLPRDALLIPVRGVRPTELQDTFDDLRGGGSRPHEALDIMAARGTPVLAATDGRIEKLFESAAGGHTIYQFDDSATHAYYYAHLDRYAPGLAEGQQVERGDVIGYVGSTGNASEDAPHLHFAIFELGPEKHWWEGTAIDPLPLLATPR